MVLGIAQGHDCGAAVITEEGTVVVAANEERFSRHKLQAGYPRRAIEACLQRLPRRSEIRAVALASRIEVVAGHGEEELIKPPMLSFKYALQRMPQGLLRGAFGSQRSLRVIVEVISRMQIARRARLSRRLGVAGLPLLPIEIVDHHLAHAASAYYTSGWNRCLVITLDASGDDACSKIYIGENGELRQLYSIPWYHSPAFYYLAVTLLLGFKVGREGKVTGLAARGSAEATIPIFQERIAYSPEKMTFVNKGGFLFAEIEYLARRLRGYSREDVSAGIQCHLEDLVIAYVRQVVRHFDLSNLPIALAGGVFANVRLNQKIAELPEVGEIFIHPHMGDGGLALGAALAVAAKRAATVGQSIRPRKIDHVYWGSAYSMQEILRTCESFDLGAEIMGDGVPELIAAELAEGRVVSHFDDAMEYGPRALGNRSILYRADDVTANDWLNRRLQRSEFMPFAPVVAAEDARRYFDVSKREYAARFMTITCDATERCRREAPAVVHVDGTARPQIVYPEIQPRLHRILRRYGEITGSPVLINTSFNMHEEPIVESPADAIRAFLAARLDVLIMGDALLRLPAGASPGASGAYRMPPE